MITKVDVYYFSPTGGTKKVAEAFAEAFAKERNMVDIMYESVSDSEFAVIAAPVFGGRIPSVVTERLQKLQGNGKQAVTLVVYGNRAYEDALLELNQTVENAGFQVIGAGAFVAQHSMVPEVGHGRPDEKDLKDICDFAEKVIKKLEEDTTDNIKVPGNYPFKPEMNMPVTPVSLSSCNLCGKCREICPVGAITIQEAVTTSPEKCMLCMACVSVCPEHIRTLPPPLQEKMEQMLGPLKSVRKENEVFL